MTYIATPKNLTNQAVLTRDGRADYLTLSTAPFPVPTVDEASAVLEHIDTGDRYRWTSTNWVQTHTKGQANPIEVSNRGDIAVPVFVQDQTTRALDLVFNQVLGSFQLANVTDPDLMTFDAVAGHNLVVGNLVEIINDDNSVPIAQ